MTAIKSSVSSSSSSSPSFMDYKMIAREALMECRKQRQQLQPLQRREQQSSSYSTTAAHLEYATISLDCSSLQSTNKKRKYMRRGSKCPSMLTMATLPLSRLFEDMEESQPSPKKPRSVLEENHAIAILTEALHLSSTSFQEINLEA
jgi:hypothetical protein